MGIDASALSLPTLAENVLLQPAAQKSPVNENTPAHPLNDERERKRERECVCLGIDMDVISAAAVTNAAVCCCTLASDEGPVVC